MDRYWCRKPVQLDEVMLSPAVCFGAGDEFGGVV